MSGLSIAMSGIRAATTRLEISSESLVNQASRAGAVQTEAAAPRKVNTTPTPKVYRPMQANLYRLANSTGGGEGVARDPAQALLEQAQASLYHRASLRALEAASDREDAGLDVTA